MPAHWWMPNDGVALSSRVIDENIEGYKNAVEDDIHPRRFACAAPERFSAKSLEYLYFLEASTASTAFCRDAVWLLYQEI